MNRPDVLGSGTARVVGAGVRSVRLREGVGHRLGVDVQAIGLGDWFRYATGGLQMLGAVALLLPATARVGAALIALTMVGAIAVHLFVLPTGIGGAAIPAVFLGFTGRRGLAQTIRRRSAAEPSVSARLEGTSTEGRPELRRTLEQAHSRAMHRGLSAAWRLLLPLIALLSLPAVSSSCLQAPPR